MLKSLNSPQSNGTRWLGNRCHQQDQNISEMQEFLEMPDCFAQKHITCSHSLMQILDNHTLEQQFTWVRYQSISCPKYIKAGKKKAEKNLGMLISKDVYTLTFLFTRYHRKSESACELSYFLEVFTCCIFFFK